MILNRFFHPVIVIHIEAKTDIGVRFYIFSTQKNYRLDVA